MFDRRNIRRIYLNITGKTKDFLLSDKSREFFVFLFFFFIFQIRVKNITEKEGFEPSHRANDLHP